MSDLRKIKSMVDIMRSNPDFVNIAVDSEEGSITISRANPGGAIAMQPAMVQAGVPQAAAAPAKEEVVEAAEAGEAISAPCVGTFYEASKPGSPAFVKIGDRVTKGDPVCIVEAMKNMNQIRSPSSGTIIKISVPNGQAVEYGQELMRIDPS